MATKGIQVYGQNASGHQVVKVGTNGSINILYDQEQVVGNIMDGVVLNSGSTVFSNSIDFGTSFVSLNLGSYWDVSTAGNVNLGVSYQSSHNGVSFYNVNSGNVNITEQPIYYVFNSVGKYGRFNITNNDGASAVIDSKAVYFKLT